MKKKIMLSIWFAFTGMCCMIYGWIFGFIYGVARNAKENLK